MALSKLGVDSEADRSNKISAESKLKARRPPEKAKTMLAQNQYNNSGQTKPTIEGS